MIKKQVFIILERAFSIIKCQTWGIALADGIISDMTSTKNQAENQYNQKIS